MPFRTNSLSALMNSLSSILTVPSSLNGFGALTNSLEFTSVKKSNRFPDHSPVPLTNLSDHSSFPWYILKSTR